MLPIIQSIKQLLSSSIK